MTSRFSEHEFLGWLYRTAPRDPRLSVPIGDDAACWGEDGPGGLLLAMDGVVEGVHAEPGPDLAETLGRKAVRTNLSDIAAMGGAAEALLLSIILPPDRDPAFARKVLDVVIEECRRFGVALAGGDTVVGGNRAVVTAAVTGRPLARPVRRSGARPGDLVLVTGELGGSILGRHISFEPRLAEAARLVALGPPTAMADVSDGLLRDLDNIARASGAGAVVRAGAVPISADARRLASESGRSPLEHALHDGEDFELVLTLPPEALDRVREGWNTATPLTVLGEVVEDEGLWLEEGGARRRTGPGGYDHGAGSGRGSS